MARRREHGRGSKVGDGFHVLDLLEPIAIVLKFVVRIPAMLLRILD